MILNVSGRTDIVAFYSKWFINRYKEGFVDVRNPYNPNLVSRINFDNVDAILFCTKNPIPILDFINNIDKPIEFHVTITPYKKDIEPKYEEYFMTQILPFISANYPLPNSLIISPEKDKIEFIKKSPFIWPKFNKIPKKFIPDMNHKQHNNIIFFL